MIIYFRTKKLQKICNRSKEATKQLGANMAKKLAQRLMELNAANSMNDISKVPPARCHELFGNRKGQFSIDLEQPYRLLFIPANKPLPMLFDHGLNWSDITEIEIIEITDPH